MTAAFDANEARILELFWCGIKRGAVNRTLHSQRSAVPSVQGFTIGGQKIKIETNRWSSNREKLKFQALLGGQEGGQV